MRKREVLFCQGAGASILDERSLCWASLTGAKGNRAGTKDEDRAVDAGATNVFSVLPVPLIRSIAIQVINCC